jgi:hypothetical protein
VAALTATACRAGLVALLDGVNGVGNVHDYRRFLRTEQDAHTHYFDGTRINGWVVAPDVGQAVVHDRRPGHPGTGQYGGAGDLVTFRWAIEGHYGIDDANASEKTFFDLAVLVADTLNGTTLSITGLARQSPCDIVQFGYAFFAGMFTLHYARLVIALTGRPR